MEALLNCSSKSVKSADGETPQPCGPDEKGEMQVRYCQSSFTHKLTHCSLTKNWIFQNAAKLIVVPKRFHLNGQQQQQQHNFIVRINLINYTDPQVTKANLGGTEDQLRVRV